MKIDAQILKKLEKLSNIDLKAEKKDQMVANLSEIVEFVENLNELDLSNKDASFATLEGGTPFREDTPLDIDKDIIDIILQNAPKKEGSFFVVPKIIE